MNIFVLHTDADRAARDQCDKHVPKMIVETAQMMASALRTHGAEDVDMPLTKSGSPYKGGYPNHPCTRWASECQENFLWLAEHGLALCNEFEFRFEKEHACFEPILEMMMLNILIPKKGGRTPFALAMPDEFRPIDIDGELEYHAYGLRAVEAYRAYYHSKEFAEWKYTDEPSWWLL